MDGEGGEDADDPATPRKEKKKKKKGKEDDSSPGGSPDSPESPDFLPDWNRRRVRKVRSRQTALTLKNAGDEESQVCTNLDARSRTAGVFGARTCSIMIEIVVVCGRKFEERSFSKSSPSNTRSLGEKQGGSQRDKPFCGNDAESIRFWSIQGKDASRSRPIVIPNSKSSEKISAQNRSSWLSSHQSRRLCRPGALNHRPMLYRRQAER